MRDASIVCVSFVLRSVFSTFYLFIRLFANKRIEYEVDPNKNFSIFVNTNKGALIRLFDYSRLKTKQGEASDKSTFPCVMVSVELALNYKRNIESAFFTHTHTMPHKKKVLGEPRAL